MNSPAVASLTSMDVNGEQIDAAIRSSAVALYSDRGNYGRAGAGSAASAVVPIA